MTHTLFGATLGRAAFSRAGRGAVAALIIASNAPDADIVTAAAGGSLGYLAWHRGPTHGPLGIVGLSVVTASLVWGWQRGIDRARRAEHASFPSLLAASAAGLAGHVLMDVPTSYGTRLLSPFDWHWYAVDLLPIVDIYLLAVLAAGLLIGRLRPALRRRIAIGALIFMASNYAVRAVSHQVTLGRVRQGLAPVLPPRCEDAAGPSLLDRWPRDTPTSRRERGATRCLVDVALVPGFVSPFRWQAIAQLSDGYHTLDIDLLGRETAAEDGTGTAWRRAVHVPDQWTPAVLRAANSDLGRVYLDFSRFPASTSMLNADRSATVTWRDLRFTAPGRPRGRSGLFVATVTLAPDGRVTSERLGE